MITAAYLMALCSIGCAYEGYDAGLVVKKKCACVNYYEPSDFTLKKVAKQKPKRDED